MPRVGFFALFGRKYLPQDLFDLVFRDNESQIPGVYRFLFESVQEILHVGSDIWGQHQRLFL
jgi:hypothetical protein